MDVKKIHVTYNDIHKLCQESAAKILAKDTLRPHLIIAIGGGGYVPARILRTFLKKEGEPNIPIQAIGLSLYEQLGTLGTHGSLSAFEAKVETPGSKVTRTQWLDFESLKKLNLIGKNVLIVDEVDDTRTTLSYAVDELQKDIAEAAKRENRVGETTNLSIFVLHNKDKTKKGTLPPEIIESGRYLAARTVADEWICYPWEANDIDLHDKQAAEEKASSLEH